MRTKTLIMLIAATLGPLPGALAQTKVDQEFTFSGNTGEASFTFQRADIMSPAPGEELLRVELALGMVVSGGSLWVDNDGPLSGHVDVRYVARASTSSDDIPIGALISQVANEDVLFLGPDNEHTGGPPIFSAQGDEDEGRLLPIDGARDVDEVMLDPLFTGLFRGSAPFTIDVDINTSFLILGLPTVAGSFGGITVEEVSLRVSYIYTPAPGALALLGVAACGLARRRR